LAIGGYAPAGPGRRTTGGGGPRRAFWLATLGAATLGLLALSPLIGPVPIPASTVVEILLHHVSGGALFPDPCAGTGASPSLCGAYEEIVWAARLPEVLLAVLAGAALGMAGGTLQGVFRNPLADPFLLGISSGGTLGAATVLIFHVGAAEASLFLPLLAFLGASATGGVLLLVARGRYGSVETLLLTGVALANFLSAVLALFLLYNPIASQQVDFWLLGGLGEASWTGDGIALGVLIVAGTLLTLFGRELNLMQLGNDVAQTAGVDARAVRVRLLLLASLVTAVAVAFTGIIGFVGLVSPHIVRRLAGSDYRVVLPGAGAVGAIFLLGARDLSLIAFPTSVLPLGIFTAFGGVPFFLYLLYRQRSVTTMGG
jgi:iron complex transport system permease protein